MNKALVLQDNLHKVTITEVGGEFTSESPQFSIGSASYALEGTKGLALGSVRVEVGGEIHSSCILCAFGFITSVGQDSALLLGLNTIIIVGPYLCALSLPSLRLEWNVRVDPGCCFGVYYSKLHDVLITHGEQYISRVTLDGNLEWSAGGKDIFTEGFTLHCNWIEAIDFNQEKYKIDISTGQSEILKSE
jgi:hypothetical protein